jgi:hypothetical protein
VQQAQQAQLDPKEYRAKQALRVFRVKQEKLDRRANKAKLALA